MEPESDPRPRLRAVRVHGPVEGVSGYDVHTRSFVRELVRQGVEVELRQLEAWKSPPRVNRDAPVFESLRSPVDARLALHFALPTQVAWSEDGLPDVVFTMFEGDRLPRPWIEPVSRCDAVVVPSASSRRAFVASGVPPEKVRSCPLGVDVERFDGSAEPLDLTDPEGRPVTERRYRFLNVCDVRPRKNVEGLVCAWLRASRPDDDAVLILKQMWKTRFERIQFMGDLRGALGRAGLELDDGAPVVFCEEILPDEAMPSVYTTATHYVSMSFGEGWDLAMMEAGASGLSLIAPDHTAYRDYLTEEIAHLLPVSKEVAACRGLLATKDPHFRAGLEEPVSWWRPDEDAAVELIRAILDGRERPTAPARKRFRERYRWERAGERLVEVLGEVLEERSDA